MRPTPPPQRPVRHYESRRCSCGHWVGVEGDPATYHFVGGDGPVLDTPCPGCHPEGRVPVEFAGGGNPPTRLPFDDQIGSDPGRGHPLFLVVTHGNGDPPRGPMPEERESLWGRLTTALEGLIRDASIQEPTDAAHPSHPGWGPILALVAEARNEDVDTTYRRLVRPTSPDNPLFASKGTRPDWVDAVLANAEVALGMDRPMPERVTARKRLKSDLHELASRLYYALHSARNDELHASWNDGYRAGLDAAREAVGPGPAADIIAELKPPQIAWA